MCKVVHRALRFPLSSSIWNGFKESLMGQHIVQRSQIRVYVVCIEKEHAETHTSSRVCSGSNYVKNSMGFIPIAYCRISVWFLRLSLIIKQRSMLENCFLKSTDCSLYAGKKTQNNNSQQVIEKTIKPRHCGEKITFAIRERSGSEKICGIHSWTSRKIIQWRKKKNIAWHKNNNALTQVNYASLVILCMWCHTYEHRINW